MFPAASPDPAIAALAPVSRADRIASILVVALYVICQIALTATHEPWRDEGQAWLWVQELSRPIDFLILPGEGHPPFWYWLLKGLSSFLSFDQARLIAPVFAILNAVLLARLLRGDVVILFVVLFSNLMLQYWGNYFRPYGLVLTTLLVAMLLDRGGRSVASLWVLALSCGIHFFSGFLLAFWLVYRWREGTPIRKMLGPSALALMFGAIALISGRGNPDGSPDLALLPERMLEVLSWPAWYFQQPLLVSIAGVALLVIGLYRAPFFLALLLGLTLVFTIGTSLTHGRLPWHTGFLLMLAFMAFTLAGPKANRWCFILLLGPQVVAGIAIMRLQVLEPKWPEALIYQQVVDNAGADFDPSTDLVVWPDYVLSGTAARHGIHYISGNNGAVVGPIDWRTRRNEEFQSTVIDRPLLYWLVCDRCERILPELTAKGQNPVFIDIVKTEGDGEVSAYRVE